VSLCKAIKESRSLRRFAPRDDLRYEKCRSKLHSGRRLHFPKAIALEGRLLRRPHAQNLSFAPRKDPPYKARDNQRGKKTARLCEAIKRENHCVKSNPLLKQTAPEGRLLRHFVPRDGHGCKKDNLLVQEYE